MRCDMWSNKKKGVALLSTLIFMSVVICVSLLMFAILTYSAVANKYEQQKLEKQVTLSKIFDDFVDNQTINNSYDFDVQIYTNQDNTNQKAVVVKKTGASAKNLYYYCICEFDSVVPTNYQILAQQQKDFYLTTQNVDGVDYYFLADLIKYVEV